MKSGHVPALALIGLACLSTTRAATYNVADLGALGGSQSAAFGINSAGQVVGQAAITGNSSVDAVLFYAGGNIDLGTFGGQLNNRANAINDAGVVVGTNTLPGNLTKAAFVAFGKTLINLGTLGGTSSTAFSINTSGQITGDSQISGNSATHAYRYQNGVMTDLGTLFGGSSFGYGINAAGHVVGESLGGGIHAFLAVANSMTNLGVLGSGNESVAYGINDNDQIVGTSNRANDSIFHAFLYEAGQMKDLGTLAGASGNATAYAINNSRVIVGTSNLVANGTDFHAFLYQGSQLSDLNDLIPQGSGWELQEARAINAAGQIAGTGVLNGVTHAYLLTPIGLNNTSSTERPRVYINGATRVATNRSHLRVEGSVGGPVVAVKYRIGGKGAYRTASGATNGWRFKAQLKMGRNLVQVYSVGSNGLNSTVAKITIVRTAG